MRFSHATQNENLKLRNYFRNFPFTIFGSWFFFQNNRNIAKVGTAIPEPGQFIKSRSSFLIVLEHGKSEMNILDI